MKIKVNDVVTLCLWVQNYEIFLESPKKTATAMALSLLRSYGLRGGSAGAHAKGAEEVGAQGSHAEWRRGRERWGACLEGAEGGLFGGTQRGVALAHGTEAGKPPFHGLRGGGYCS